MFFFQNLDSDRDVIASGFFFRPGWIIRRGDERGLQPTSC